MKYFEAFGEGGFHAAFMTTYAFGSLAFEDIREPGSLLEAVRGGAVPDGQARP